MDPSTLRHRRRLRDRPRGHRLGRGPGRSGFSKQLHGLSVQRLAGPPRSSWHLCSLACGAQKRLHDPVVGRCHFLALFQGIASGRCIHGISRQPEAPTRLLGMRAGLFQWVPWRLWTLRGRCAEWECVYVRGSLCHVRLDLAVQPPQILWTVEVGRLLTGRRRPPRCPDAWMQGGLHTSIQIFARSYMARARKCRIE